MKPTYHLLTCFVDKLTGYLLYFKSEIEMCLVDNINLGIRHVTSPIDGANTKWNQNIVGLALTQNECTTGKHTQLLLL